MTPPPPQKTININIGINPWAEMFMQASLHIS